MLFYDSRSSKHYYVEFYVDFYGCTYTLTTNLENYSVELLAHDAGGRLFYLKTYNSLHGAKIAMGKLSEGTSRLVS